MDVEIRPMRPTDAPGVDDVCMAVLYHVPDGVDSELRRARSLRRILHLGETDPGGAWVAERDGEVAGIALALVREGIWGLSLFAVAADVQGRGVGRRLLEASLRHGDGARGHVILSSTDPAAMRRYARAGFELRPAVCAAGIVERERIPDGVAVVEDAGSAGVGLADAIGREVRGAGHGRDLPVILEAGNRLLVFEDRAFAVVREEGVALLAARDDAAASTVLWGAFAAARPGAKTNVDFLTAGQDWAIATCLDAGLALSPDGPVFTRGALGPLRPYVPSGAYL